MKRNSMKRNALTLPVLLAAQFLAGCDSQAGTDYRGEPLLSINGSVVIENQNPPENLVPALAFINYETRSLDFAEVEVAGEFPAQFTLDVFEPPPAGALFDSEDPGDENEPTFAMGFITAVNADHPASVPGDEERGSSSSCGPSGCTRVVDVCAPGEGCYHRVTHCDLNGDNCVVVEESGNPALARGWLRYVAGLSANYVVLYFPDGVRAGTTVSHHLNGSQALEPGYHLVEVTPFSPAEEAEQETCLEGARQDALDRFNAEHGTAYEAWFDVPSEVVDQRRLIDVAARERGCLPGQAHTKLVRDPAQQSITVTISPDVELGFGLF
jgi:hypothetical protein